MFVVTLSYVADLTEIDAALADHIAWLKAQYADGVFLASGSQVPRTGGVILAAGLSRDDLDRRLELDPFSQRRLAEYAVVEFTATTIAAGLERLQA